MSESDTHADLEGLLVVALEQAVAAPFASSRLAEAGARVIKLERPGGDFARRYDDYVNGLSAYFVWLNRGKESVRFDLKDPRDLELFRRLIAKADVFIQNLGPGVTERAGIGSESLRAANPRLITCDISGYGRSGPASHLKAYDLLVQAESGLAALTGGPEAPARVGVSVCDIGTGMYAHQAILQALYARERTGRGRAVEVSLFHSMADWMNVPYLQFRYGGIAPRRSGLSHPTIAPYSAFACRDGHLILIAIQNEQEWQSLCAGVLGRPELAADPRFATNTARVDNRAELDAIVAAGFARVDRATMVEALEKARIAYGRLSSLDDLHRHPQNRFVSVETSKGPIEMIAPPVAGMGILGAGRSLTVPDYAEHDASVRAEFLGA